MKRIIFVLVVLITTSMSSATGISVYYNLVAFTDAQSGGIEGISGNARWDLFGIYFGSTDFSTIDITDYGFHVHADSGFNTVYLNGVPPENTNSVEMLTTRQVGDSITFTFENSPNPVHSFGTTFAGMDNAGNSDNYELKITATNNWGETTQPSPVVITGSQFVGFVSDIPLVSVTLYAGSNNYPGIGPIYEDSPEPATLLLLGFGAAILRRKR